MKEVTGNLWDYYQKGHWISITTNGFIKKDNTAVMGRGIAHQCARRMPQIPRIVGAHLLSQGNHVKVIPPPFKIITFPVKHDWWSMADPALIRQSVGEIVKAVDVWGMEDVYMVRPGCGNGGLKWHEVKPLLCGLDDRFTIVELADWQSVR